MILILSHINADFDAFASMVAAQKLYPDARMALGGSPEPSVRDFLDTYGDRFDLLKEKHVDPGRVTQLVLVDVGASARLGAFAHLAESGVPIHMYNHHPATDEDLPAEVKVHRRLGANTCILLELLIERGIQLTPFEATVMALGIYEDTGSLTYPSTTEEDLKLVAYLLSAGADLGTVSHYVSRELSFEQVTLLGDLARSLKVERVHQVNVGLASASAEGYVGDLAVLTQKIKTINNLDALFSVVGMEGRVFVIGRSRIEAVDVGRILARLGGGGHPTAGSATLRGQDPERAKDRLMKVLQEEVKPDISAREIMSHPVDVIAPDWDLEAAHSRILKTHHGCLPIVENGQIKGILTGRDAAKALQHGLGKAPVTQCMSSDVVTVGPDAPYGQIQQRMIERKIGYLPVVEDGRLVGIISRGDLLRHTAGVYRGQAPEGAAEEFDPAQMRALIEERVPDKIRKLLRQFGELADELSAGGRAETLGEPPGPCNVYAVGGLPRDLILGRPNWDVDIVVEGDGIAFARAFVARHGGRVVAHKRFQTAIIAQPNGFKTDVATARIEHYEHPAALPVVESSVVKHDLYRRDFTINSMAIALNPERWGRLVDYFGGRRDLKLGVVRVLHNLSFVEDPTRILRAVRFEQRYGFRIDEKTEHLLRQAVGAKVLDKVKGQRVRDELILLLKEAEPVGSFARLEALGALGAIHPELCVDEGCRSLFGRMRQVLDWFSLLYLDEPCEGWIVYLLALVDPLSRRAKTALQKRLSFPKRAWEAVESIADRGRRTEALLGSAKELGPSRVYAACHGVGTEVLLFLMARSTSERLRRRVSLYFDRLRGVRTDITGEDLAAMGVPGGKLYGTILGRVLAARLDGEVETKGEELALAERVWGEEGSGR